MAAPYWFWLGWIIVIAGLAEPWLLNRVDSYNVYQDEWLRYAGVMLFGVYMSFDTIYRFLSPRLSNARKLTVPFLFLIGVPLLVSVVIVIFHRPLYAHGRFALERSALEAYTRSGGLCPTRQCLHQDNLTAFVWSANNRTWQGVCYDPNQVMARALAARDADRRAEHPDRPRVFGAVAQRADHLTGNWYACAASTRTLGARR